MCGLVGIVGNIDAKLERVMKDLLAMDVLRGDDSIGVFLQYRNLESDIVKKAMLPQDFFCTKAWKASDKLNKRVMLGHNRWATQGRVNTENAHPFEIGDIVGAHNGTLRNQSLLPDSKDFDVDSENIIHSLDKVGVGDTIKNLNGAYALTWYDWRDDTLNVCRNEERTLFHCYTEDGTALLWASEEWMLWGACIRNKQKFTKPVKFEVGKHYKFKVPDVYTAAGKVVLLSEESVETYVVPTYRGVTYSKGYVHAKKKGEVTGNLLMRHSLMTGDTIEFTTTPSESGVVSVIGTLMGSDCKVRVVIRGTSAIGLKLKNGGTFLGTLMGYTSNVLIVQDNSVVESGQEQLEDGSSKEKKIKGYDGRPLSEDKFNLMHIDCAWCSSPVQFGDETAVWIQHNDMVCGDCCDNKEVREYMDVLDRGVVQ